MVFQANDICYRVMYLGWRQEVRVAQSDLGCGPIAPERGPNEEVDGSEGPYVQTDPEAANYDPVLDNLDKKSWVLISKATLSNGGTEPNQMVPVFKFYPSEGGSYLADGKADSNSTNPFYLDGSKASNTDRFTVDLLVGQPIEGGSISIPDQEFSTVVYLDN